MTLPNIDTFDDLGGEKANDHPVADPTTDIDATQFSMMCANVAMSTRTACRAIACFIGKASSPPDDPSSNVHQAVWGDTVLVKPTAARTGTGVYTLTWPSSVTDERGESADVNIRWVQPFIYGASAYIVQATVTSANVVTVNVYTNAGVASDAVGATITVFVY